MKSCISVRFSADFLYFRSMRKTIGYLYKDPLHLYKVSTGGNGDGYCGEQYTFACRCSYSLSPDKSPREGAGGRANGARVGMVHII